VDSAYQQRLDELQYLRYEANTRARTITNRLRRQAARGAERPAVRWGILGLGQMAHTFAKALNCVPGAELVAVASRSVAKAQAFAAKHSVRHSFGNYADMLRADNVPVDVVYVSTPVDCHYDHTKMCLQMGKNVLCEKPITLNAEQCESLTELAGANGTFLMEGMWMKCLPTYISGMSWARGGVLGDIGYAHIDLSKAGGGVGQDGVLLDYGVYALAFAVGLAGHQVRIESAHCRRDHRGRDRHWVINLSGSGVDIFTTISADVDGDRTAVVVGDNGRIVWPRQFNRATAVRWYRPDGRLAKSFEARYRYHGFEHEIGEVHRCLENGTLQSDLVPWIDSLTVMTLVDRLRSTT
jgi:predicted dehydrogenase